MIDRQRSAVIVVQARMGSTRLPGKVLRPLAGRPMLERILKQVQAVRRAGLVVAASDDPADDALIRFAKEREIPCVRGAADDIVGRLAGAARAADSPQATVRVWGDCPFVCPDIIERLLERLFVERLDFIDLGRREVRTLPVGLDAEAYRTAWLIAVDTNVTDPYLREYPFELVRERGAEFRWAALTPSSPIGPEAHLTVDYPEDLVAAQKIYEVLQADSRAFSSNELFELLAGRPDLVAAFSSGQRQAEFTGKSALRKARI